MTKLQLWLAAGATLVAVLLLAVALTNRTEDEPPTVEGKIRSGRIRFPGYWSIRQPSGAEDLISPPSNYIVRASPSSPPDLLFSVLGRGQDRPGDATYIVGRDFAVRAAPASGWEGAHILAPSTETIHSFDSHGNGLRVITFRGKSFNASGPSTTGAFASPDEKWIALLGVRGQRSLLERLQFLGRRRLQRWRYLSRSVRSELGYQGFFEADRILAR